MKQTQIYAPLMAQTRKMTPCSREKQKLRMTPPVQLYLIPITLEVYEYESFVLIAGDLRTAVLADTVFR